MSPRREPWVNVAARVAATEAEGPGLRYALWVQGCPLRCDGCCNPAMLPFRPAMPTPVSALVAELRASPGLDGVTILGGEPFAQPLPVAAFAEAARALGLSVIVFSGYALEEIRAQRGAGPRRLLAACDVLVDGPYVAALAAGARRNVGSTNQRVVALTARGAALAERWDEGPEVVEVRIAGERAFVNGVPAGVGSATRALRRSSPPPRSRARARGPRSRASGTSAPCRSPSSGTSRRT